MVGHTVTERNQGPFEVVIFDDFVASTTAGLQNWNISTGGGTAANNTTQVDDKSIGVIACTINSGNVNNRVIYNLGTERLVLGNGECCFRAKIKMATADSSTDRSLYYIGLGDTLNGEHTDGIYFVFDSSVNSIIVARTSLASTRTEVSTGVPISAAVGSWMELMFIVNSDATSVSFYINNNLVGTQNSSVTIPSGTGRAVSPILQFKRKAVSGTVNRLVYIDYVYVKKTMLTRF